MTAKRGGIRRYPNPRILMTSILIEMSGKKSYLFPFSLFVCGYGQTSHGIIEMKPPAKDNPPSRIFLDTCTFQAIADCGGYVFGEDPFPMVEDYAPDSAPQVIQRPDGRDILENLRAIFLFNERAHFDWIISPASLAEIDAGADLYRSEYARDIIAHSDICLADNPPRATVDSLSVSFKALETHKISPKDMKLLQDALRAECDHFLTIEKRLPRQAQSISKYVPLVVCSPAELWKKLEPNIVGL